MPRVRLATRGSRLALWQAEWVAARLTALGAQIELVIIETQGDRERTPFAQMQGQGFFTKAVQDALLAGQAEVAVHSYKDLPSKGPEGLEIAAIPQREDPRELLLIHPQAFEAAEGILPLKAGARVGSSAVRRQAQLGHLRPDLELLELRGNIPTRVERLRSGQYEAILLAQAGVKRLGLDLSGLHHQILGIEQLVPAPAQGALALECRSQDPDIKSWLQRLDDPAARATVMAERGLMTRLAGGCQLALGANARLTPQGLELTAWYGGRGYMATGATPESVAETLFGQIRAEHPEAVSP